MARWLSLLIIGTFVVTGMSACVLVVADEDVAQDIREDRDRTRLARKITKDFEHDELLGDSDIRISEDDGVVTLRGEVDSVTLLQHAIDIAARHTGVDTVVSHLTVEVDL